MGLYANNTLSWKKEIDKRMGVLGDIRLHGEFKGEDITTIKAHELASLTKMFSDYLQELKEEISRIEMYLDDLKELSKKKEAQLKKLKKEQDASVKKDYQEEVDNLEYRIKTQQARVSRLKKEIKRD